MFHSQEPTPDERRQQLVNDFWDVTSENGCFMRQTGTDMGNLVDENSEQQTFCVFRYLRLKITIDSKYVILSVVSVICLICHISKHDIDDGTAEYAPEIRVFFYWNKTIVYMR